MKKKTIVIIFILLLLSQILLGCSPSQLTDFLSPPTQTPTPTPTIVPTVTNTPVPTIAPGTTRISEKDGMTIVYIPEGEFLMGSTDEQVSEAVNQCIALGGKQNDCESLMKGEKPRHKVAVDAFWIDKTVVTNAMYQKCANVGTCMARETHFVKSEQFQDDQQPAVGVSWFDAVSYCNWAGRRLPTEAEWEKAARGTDGRIYPWGDQPADKTLANFDGKIGKTTGVGNYPDSASPYGVLDMSGNVAQWLFDWYSDNYYETNQDRDPDGPDSGVDHVVRGGNWKSEPWEIRAAKRDYLYPLSKFPIAGFRCAMSADNPARVKVLNKEIASPASSYLPSPSDFQLTYGIIKKKTDLIMVAQTKNSPLPNENYASIGLFLQNPLGANTAIQNGIYTLIKYAVIVLADEKMANEYFQTYNKMENAQQEFLVVAPSNASTPITEITQPVQNCDESKSYKLDSGDGSHRLFVFSVCRVNNTLIGLWGQTMDTFYNSTTSVPDSDLVKQFNGFFQKVIQKFQG